MAPRVLFAILAAAFFATPIAARLVGVAPEAFENRPLAPAPELSQGWNAFQQTSAFLTDQMPLRAQAVRANTRIWTDVFGTDPRYGRDAELARDQALPFAGAIEHDDRPEGLLPASSGARTGRDGWLFLPQELSTACDATPTDDRVLQRWSQVVRSVRAAGHESLMFVVPYKASIYPEYLPRKYPFDHCALEAKDRFWRLMSRDGPAVGVREIRSKLLRLKAQAGGGLFQRKDTHWTTLGALTLVDAVLDEVGDGIELLPSEIVDRGTVRYSGDLVELSARSERDTRHEYDIEREPDASRVPGRTLLVCDSFTYKWLHLFKPYFENVREISWYKTDDQIAAAIRRSDTVILEATELLMKVQAAEGEKAESLARLLAR